MFGRRSHQRFAIATSSEGTLRVLRDVLVERLVRDEIVVIGRRAGVVGETLRIEVEDTGCGLSVRVAESRPAVAEGTVRHRICLLPAVSTETLERLVSDTASTQDPLSILAVLASEMRVRVLNCSSSGCLLESGARVEAGTIASLRLVLDNVEFADDVHVVRCCLIEGGSTYHVGAEFLWTAPPTQQSFRLGIGRHTNPASLYSGDRTRSGKNVVSSQRD